ncbi:saccharopine dehydrogenase NADP-binding domain-containing protein [Streptomyces sp. NPDC004069]
MLMPEVWILGGTGRSGRVIATELLRRNITPTLVGRDAVRLRKAAEKLPGEVRTVVAESVDASATQIRRRTPDVVINTIGPFVTTAEPIVRACLPATHYIDLANDVATATRLLLLQDEVRAAGPTVVTGSGFGATATESLVVKLCENHPTPQHVRVDMIPSLEIEAGPLGEALAASMTEGLPGVPGGRRFGGRRYRDGRLSPMRLAGEPHTLSLPDGSRVTSVGVPLGELVAAQRASGAASVVSGSTELPSSPIMRAIVPLAAQLMAIKPLRTFATRRLAAVEIKPRPRPREHSWAHAVVEWVDGGTRTGWLRIEDAQTFTGTVPAEVTRRLLAGEGRPGVHFPAALFGPSLAEDCGGTYLV